MPPNHFMVSKAAGDQHQKVLTVPGLELSGPGKQGGTSSSHGIWGGKEQIPPCRSLPAQDIL